MNQRSFHDEFPRKLCCITLLERRQERGVFFHLPRSYRARKARRRSETEKGLSRRRWKEVEAREGGCGNENVTRERIVECVVTRAFRANKKATRSYHLACFPTRAQTRLLTREIWKRGGRGDYECDPRAPPRFLHTSPFTIHGESSPFLLREIFSFRGKFDRELRFVGFISLDWLNSLPMFKARGFVYLRQNVIYHRNKKRGEQSNL